MCDLTGLSVALNRPNFLQQFSIRKLVRCRRELFERLWKCIQMVHAYKKFALIVIRYRQSYTDIPYVKRSDIWGIRVSQMKIEWLLKSLYIKSPYLVYVCNTRSLVPFTSYRFPPSFQLCLKILFTQKKLSVKLTFLSDF